MAKRSLVGEQVRDFIAEKLREEYPYMSIDAVHEIAKKSIQVMASMIQEHATSAAKARSGFTSLPAELRNRIYHLALRPSNDGDGGIKGCKAILISVDRIQERPKLGSAGYRIPSWAEQPALTRLSRQTRAEALPVFYGINNFVIASSIDGCVLLNSKDDGSIVRHVHDDFNSRWLPCFGGAQRWLRCIGPKNLDCIKHLDICHTMWFDCLSHSTKLAAGFDMDLAAYLRSADITLPPETTHLMDSSLFVNWD